MSDKDENLIEYPLALPERSRRIKQMQESDDLYIVGTSQDCADALRSHGAIAYETYLADASLCKAVERVNSMNGRYGEARIFRLVPVEFDEAKEAIGFIELPEVQMIKA